MTSTPSQRYTYHLTPQAYILPLLHAAKNISSSVNGVLLGRIDMSTYKIIVEASIPLLHNYLTLTPMMEIGLDMCEMYAKEKGLVIVGYYQANSDGSVELGRIGTKILESLKAKFQDAFAIVIDDSRFNPDDVPFIIYHPTSSKSIPIQPLKPVQGSLHEPFNLPSIPSLLSDALKMIRDDGLHRELGDFDDHLEDVRIDWINNPTVREGIRKRFS